MLTRRIRSGWGAVLCAAFSLTVLALIFIGRGGDINRPGPKGGLVRLAFEFVAGCLLCRAYRLGFAWRFWHQGNILALAMLAVAFAWRPLAPLAVLPFGYSILSLAHDRNWLSGALSGRVAVFLGEISYSLYMMHFMLIQVAGWFMAHFALSKTGPAGKIVIFVLIAAIFLVSTATWRLVEWPARRIGRSLADRLVPPQPVGTTAAA
jgi:peptidoglycan/LPS O-acetylase OafA/YrhL